MADAWESIFEEQVFAQEQEDAGAGSAAQHDEDTCHGADSQWIRLIEAVDVRAFEAGHSLVPAVSTGIRQNDHLDRSSGEGASGARERVE